ncbi:PepSY domain-containing protein [Litorimonas sp. RW-G-Af-16]|uniref:PepSY domain-containing protein n=1 Tax=Litorimonas sp. RW-G-Af-16 TaxID=3241168 RepID=UPI00390CCF20
MMKTRRYMIAALSAALLTSGAMSAHASSKPVEPSLSLSKSLFTSSFAAPQQTRDLLAQRQISASDAKSIALRRVRGGEVVDISKTGNTYRVRVIGKDGRVVDVYIDATTGRVKR